MLRKDFSLHFLMDDKQTFLDVNDKFINWYEGQFDSDSPIIWLDVAEYPEAIDKPVLHHCFLPEEDAIKKGYGTDIYDTLFAESCENQVVWSKTDETILGCRINMLRNLARLNGVAIFIGRLEGGVEKEYRIAKGYNLFTIHIE